MNCRWLGILLNALVLLLGTLGALLLVLVIVFIVLGIIESFFTPLWTAISLSVTAGLFVVAAEILLSSILIVTGLLLLTYALFVLVGCPPSSIPTSSPPPPPPTALGQAPGSTALAPSIPIPTEVISLLRSLAVPCLCFLLAAFAIIGALTVLAFIPASIPFFAPPAPPPLPAPIPEGAAAGSTLLAGGIGFALGVGLTLLGVLGLLLLALPFLIRCCCKKPGLIGKLLAGALRLIAGGLDIASGIARGAGQGMHDAGKFQVEAGDLLGAVHVPLLTTDSVNLWDFLPRPTNAPDVYVFKSFAITPTAVFTTVQQKVVSSGNVLVAQGNAALEAGNNLHTTADLIRTTVTSMESSES